MQNIDFDIIMMAHPRWDGPYSSTAYSLAKELAAHTRVFYIDNPFTLRDLIVERNTAHIKRRREALLKSKNIFTSPDENYSQLIAVTPHFILPVNWLPDGFFYDQLSRLNDLLVNKSINQTIKEYKIKRYVFINSFNPYYGKHFKYDVKPLLKIYQNVDDISQSKYMSRHGVRTETNTIKDSDFTLVTSSELKRQSSKYSANVYLLPNAANVKLFNKAVTEDLAKPSEIAQIPSGKKIICYTGNICMRLDYELLIKVATRNADKILLMIGPFSNNSYKTSGLEALPNVIFTGKKTISELPAYLRYSDCCIIPFLRNKLTKSIYPLKINEYLSAGKPVVSTDFSEDIITFEDIALVSKNHDDFVDNIQKAIFEDSEALKIKRMEYASGNNWEARAVQLLEITKEFLKEKINKNLVPA